MVFSRQGRVVFIDTDTVVEPTEEMLDIILSPSYYWVKRLQLPVKSVREVKKLLPSIFEDTLPEGKYSYDAYSEGESYIAYAYSDKEILNALGTKGIKPSQINRVYFAQSEFDTLEGAAKLGEEHVMTVQNGIVVKLPALFAPDAPELTLEEHKLSRSDIELTRYAHIADKKSQLLFAAFMGILIALFVSEWFIVTSKTATIEAEASEVFSSYGLKNTRLQNESVLKRLESDYARQMKLRSVTEKLLDVTLQKSEKVIMYELKGEKLVAEYLVDSEARAKAVIIELKRDALYFKERYNDGKLHVEVAL